MLENLGDSTGGDLLFFPNFIFQVHHLDLFHRVRALMPADKRVGRFKIAGTVAGRMAADRACFTVSVENVAVGKAETR